MTKDEFASKLAGKTGITKAKAAETINAIFSTDSGTGIVAVELDEGRDFTITGLGTFWTRDRKALMVRIPQTGAQIHIPAMTVTTFRAGKGIKDRVRV